MDTEYSANKPTNTPFKNSKRDPDLSFHWGSERRCDCDRSDTAPVTFSIYRQQKGANPLTAGPGPRGNFLYLKAECGHTKVLTGPFLFVLSCILIGSPKSDMSPAILFVQRLLYG